MSKTAPSLKALAEDKDVDHGIGKLTIFKADPNVVQFEAGWNGRDEGPDLIEYRQRLKAAMKAGAFIPPIDVQVVEGVPICRDGHSRTLMARELVAEGFPYVLQAREIRGNDAEMRYHMLGSAAGRPLTPLEQGRQFLLLTRMGETVAAIAARLGQHRSTIENGLKLAEMPAAVQKMVGAGKVASHTALKTVKQHGKEAATVLATAVKDAEAKGKKKATAKTLPPGPGPKVRGQTLPPGNTPVATKGPKAIVGNPATGQIGEAAVVLPPPSESVVLLKQLAQRIAGVNLLVSNLDRKEIEGIVMAARGLLGVK